MCRPRVCTVTGMDLTADTCIELKGKLERRAKEEDLSGLRDILVKHQVPGHTIHGLGTSGCLNLRDVCDHWQEEQTEREKIKAGVEKRKERVETVR